MEDVSRGHMYVCVCVREREIGSVCKERSIKRHPVFGALQYCNQIHLRQNTRAPICARARVRICVRAFVRVYVRPYVCVRACLCPWMPTYLYGCAT